MSDERRKRGWFWLAMVLLLGLYVGGYFALAIHAEGSGRRLHFRSFRYKPIQDVYWPLGWLECKLRREPVIFYTYDANGDVMPGNNFVP